MNPDNCSALFNDITLTTWSEYLNHRILDEIYDPLKTLICNTFQRYQAFTPFKDYCSDGFKEELAIALPKSQMFFSQQKLGTGINIKACISADIYINLKLSPKNESSYDTLLNFLSREVYDALYTKALIEF